MGQLTSGGQRHDGSSTRVDYKGRWCSGTGTRGSRVPVMGWNEAGTTPLKAQSNTASGKAIEAGSTPNNARPMMGRGDIAMADGSNP